MCIIGYTEIRSSRWPRCTWSVRCELTKKLLTVVPIYLLLSILILLLRSMHHTPNKVPAIVHRRRVPRSGTWLSLGKLLVNLWQVVKRTNTLLSTLTNGVVSTDHGFFRSWVQTPPSTGINFFTLSPYRT